MLKRLNQGHIAEVLDNLRELEENETPKAVVIDADILTSGGSVAYALVIDDKTIAIGGVRELWHGCGEAWLIASEEVRKHPIATTKAAKVVFDEADAKGFRRIQCTVDERFDSGQRWIVNFGFHIESLLEKYGVNGNNHFLYARLSDG